MRLQKDPVTSTGSPEAAMAKRTPNGPTKPDLFAPEARKICSPEGQTGGFDSTLSEGGGREGGKEGRGEGGVSRRTRSARPESTIFAGHIGRDEQKEVGMHDLW